MTKKDWQRLRRQIEINTRMGKLKPVEENALDEFEEQHGVRLPQSYRTFCQVFGAGEFGKLFKIAVPGYQGKVTGYSLEHLNRTAHEGQEYDEYSKNPEQHKRGLFFCLDILGSFHFFDPEEITDNQKHEFAAYTVFRDYELQRTADNFWKFITECCLGDRHHLLITDPAPTQLFMPVNV